MFCFDGLCSFLLLDLVGVIFGKNVRQKVFGVFVSIFGEILRFSL